MMLKIAPRTGVAFGLKRGQKLRVTDLEGEQVADLICYSLEDAREVLSSGRTFDYSSTIFPAKGHSFYSNRSRVMFKMLEDTVGRHDFLLTPCSAETFRIIYGHSDPHQGCQGNLAKALAPFEIAPDHIPTTLNLFMNVDIDGETGQFTVKAPKSRAGGHVLLEAKMDLIVGLTACSAGQSNNYSFKPIGYEIMGTPQPII